MRRRLSAVLATAALAALPRAASAAPTSILLLGDSITEGQQSEPAGASFAELLAQSLGAGFELANIGCGGASSLDWTTSRGDAVCGEGFALPNLYTARALPELPADLVIVLLGSNDAVGFLELEPTLAAVYRDAIAEITADLLSDGAGAVLLLAPPPNFWSPFAEFFLEGYRDEISGLCGAPGDAVWCGPDLFALLGPGDFESGSIHPNAFGHAKIAAALDASVRAAVPEPGSALLLAAGLAALARRRRCLRRAD